MKSMTNTQKQRVIDLSDKLQKESSVVKVTTSQDDVLLESNQTRVILFHFISLYSIYVFIHFINKYRPIWMI